VELPERLVSPKCRSADDALATSEKPMPVTDVTYDRIDATADFCAALNVLTGPDALLVITARSNV